MRHLKSVLWCGLFVGALVVGDRLLAAVGELVVARSPDRFVQVYSDTHAADVLVFGNSRADRHFPATRLSKTLEQEVVNLGIGAESMALAEVLLRDYLDRGRAPNLIIIEITCLMANPERVGDMHFLGLFSDRIRDLTRTSRPPIYVASQFLRLTHFNSGMFYRALYAHLRPRADRLHAASIGAAALRQLREEPQRALRAHPANLAALERIVALAADRGVRLELVVAPYLAIFEDRRRLEAVQNWVEDVHVQLGTDVSIRDYSELLSEPRYFRDSVHLNAAGVRQFIDRLITDGVFGADAEESERRADRWRESWERDDA